MLILASASAIRTQMLGEAGIAHEVVPARIDEDEVKQRLDDPGAIAAELARAKALAVSSQRPGDWVIGSDSVVSVGGRMFAKPRDRAEAANHLRAFSGETMILTSGVALALGGNGDWCHVDQARLNVRSLSDDFISEYLDAEWPAVGQCVGVFRMEGRGVQLFKTVEGSHFTILGMPLLPLLSALRERRLIAA